MNKLPGALFIVDPRKKRLQLLKLRIEYSNSSDCRYKL